jgi:hypothetical protein
MEHLGQIQWKYSDPTAAFAVKLSLRHATSNEKSARLETKSWMLGRLPVLIQTAAYTAAGDGAMSSKERT